MAGRRRSSAATRPAPAPPPSFPIPSLPIPSSPEIMRQPPPINHQDTLEDPPPPSILRPPPDDQPEQSHRELRVPRITSSRRALTRALELAREALQLDSTNEEPEAAVIAYGRSLALIGEVIERIRRGEDSTETRRRNGRPRSALAQEEEVRRLQNIYDTYADRINILSIIFDIPVPHSASNEYSAMAAMGPESAASPTDSQSPTSDTGHILPPTISSRMAAIMAQHDELFYAAFPDARPSPRPINASELFRDPASPSPSLGEREVSESSYEERDLDSTSSAGRIYEPLPQLAPPESVVSPRVDVDIDLPAARKFAPSPSAPSPIEIPNASLHGPRVQRVRSSSTAQSRHGSVFSSLDDLLGGDSFVPSTGRSGASVLTRADSASERPSGEHHFSPTWSAEEAQRKSGGGSAGGSAGGLKRRRRSLPPVPQMPDELRALIAESRDRLEGASVGGSEAGTSSVPHANGEERGAQRISHISDASEDEYVPLNREEPIYPSYGGGMFAGAQYFTILPGTFDNTNRELFHNPAVPSPTVPSVTLDTLDNVRNYYTFEDGAEGSPSPDSAGGMSGMRSRRTPPEPPKPLGALSAKSRDRWRAGGGSAGGTSEGSVNETETSETSASETETPPGRDLKRKTRQVSRISEAPIPTSAALPFTSASPPFALNWQQASMSRAATTEVKRARHSSLPSTSGLKVVACNFCQARKLRCDGIHPACSNCARRSLPCTYVRDSERKAPLVVITRHRDGEVMIEGESDPKRSIEQVKVASVSALKEVPGEADGEGEGAEPPSIPANSPQDTTRPHDILRSSTISSEFASKHSTSPALESDDVVTLSDETFGQEQLEESDVTTFVIYALIWF
ncbi:hypothetical protein B0H16DRAFT_105837 [Mycena metata]|uniref:Zn(2)-C6 fungal-type domain-containing protein n=1 Tax=Mycena metata TaxID=1033252 RepID=A0AAD7I8A4_9AGAR|nr:hypothetical protein B0H16DRAFT_105837 [Mycena metata]